MVGCATSFDVATNSSPRIPSHVPRRSLSVALSPLRLIDGLQFRSSPYSMLPEEPIKLSVLKLDGSSFEIEVMKTATVGDVKLAVEFVFTHMPKKPGRNISWPHLWGRFCLSYEGQKLITDTDSIGDFGIKDGDQLRFIRHVSNGCVLMKKRGKNRTSPLKSPRLSSPFPLTKTRKGKEKKHEEDEISADPEDGRYRNHKKTGKKIVHRKESGFLLGGVLRGWLSYSVFQSTKGTNKHTNPDGSSRKNQRRFSCGFRKLIGVFGIKGYSKEDTGKRRLISNP